MVLHHVAQSAGAVIKTGPSPNPERFRCRDLHVLDVMSVPKRCENRVRESQDQDILRGFLAQKMIDPVSLLFREGIADDAIELARRSQIGSERFLDNDASPASFAGLV